MKHVLLSAILSIVISLPVLSADVQILVMDFASSADDAPRTTIEIPSGHYLEILAIYGAENAGMELTVKNVTFPYQQIYSSSNIKGYASRVYGPATAKIYNGSNIRKSVLQYVINEREPEADASPAVSIPNDNSGDYSVVLEASSDLQTWSEIQPGTYPSTTSKRFFRTRLIKK